MGRYTLNVEAFGLKSPVLVREDGKPKEKVSLMTIDALTLGSNPLFVLKELDFENARFFSQGTMYISYISNKQLKKLQVLYYDRYGLRSIAQLGKSKIDIESKEFNNFIDNVFIPMVKDFRFLQFLRDNDFLSPKLNEYIGYLYGTKYSEEFCVSKIKDYASSYIIFRKLVIAVELFKNPNCLKQTPSFEEENEPEEFFDDREKEAYQEYMDNLPDSFDVHSK